MKKLRGLLAGWGVCVVLLAVGCDPMNPMPDYYHADLILGGKKVTLNYGLRETHLDDPNATVWGGGASLRIEAQNQQQEAGTLVSIGCSLSPTISGDFVARYEVGQTAGLTLIIGEGPTGYSYSATSGFVTIDTFGDVGGDVEGSFYLTFESASAAPSWGTPLAASCEFRLLRLPDSSS